MDMEGILLIDIMVMVITITMLPIINIFDQVDPIPLLHRIIVLQDLIIIIVHHLHLLHHILIIMEDIIDDYYIMKALYFVDSNDVNE